MGGRWDEEQERWGTQGETEGERETGEQRSCHSGSLPAGQQVGGTPEPRCLAARLGLLLGSACGPCGQKQPLLQKAGFWLLCSRRRLPQRELSGSAWGQDAQALFLPLSRRALLCPLYRWEKLKLRRVSLPTQGLPGI